ncbi:MAG: 4-hydroxy-3-methylbut-2-enyl diphosphate reductase [Thermodesulfobacteriota bacterium]
MKVILAKKAGFCMGVRRAVETTLDTVHKGDGKIATFGPLIHNPQVLGLLQDQGVDILKEIPEHLSGTVIIRAHGVPPADKEKLAAAGARVMDATCPRVVKVQAIIRTYREKDHATIIIGDKNHAEVVGLMGYAAPDVQVVSDENDLAGLAVSGPYIIVSQTTQDELAFQRLSAAIMARFPGGKVFNTICDSTHKRQEEVRNLARMVPAMVVVGGTGSANTQRLGQIAAEIGCRVFMAETEADLDCRQIATFDRIGVTAGASTPTWMINRVVRWLESCPAQGDSWLKIFSLRLIHALLASNLFVAVAGGLLALVCGLLLGSRPYGEDFFVAAGYLLAMHNMNRFADFRTGRMNDPLLENFWRRFSVPLLAFSGSALLISLFLTRLKGLPQFVILLSMSILGILYTVPFIPKIIAAIIRVRRLKEIPGSKTFFVALAWAFVTVLIPGLGEDLFSPQTFSVFVLIVLFVFIRTLLYDVFDVQGDRIAGKETLPVCIGEKGSLRLLYVSLAALVVLLIVFPVAGLIAPAAPLLLVPVASLLVLTRLYETRRVVQGMRLEFWLESHFYLMALCVWAGVGLG